MPMGRSRMSQLSGPTHAFPPLVSSPFIHPKATTGRPLLTPPFPGGEAFDPMLPGRPRADRPHGDRGVSSKDVTRQAWE